MACPKKVEGCDGPNGPAAGRCAFCKTIARSGMGMHAAPPPSALLGPAPRSIVPIRTPPPPRPNLVATPPSTPAPTPAVSTPVVATVQTIIRPTPPPRPAPVRSASPPRAVATNAAPATVVAPRPPVATKDKIGKCLADGGPGKMTGNPDDLIKSKRGALEAVATYAVGDAIRFDGSATAQAKETALRRDSARTTPMFAAEQTAGGKIHYSQTDLKSILENTKKAEGAVCTTFACCAAQILTDGARQTGTVRVEVIGVARNLGTHMFVVCGRQGNELNKFSTWGAHYRIVDLWAAALSDNPKAFLTMSIGAKDWRFVEGKMGQFYDNSRADPEADELRREANTAAVDKSAKRREKERLEGELKNTPAFLKAKRDDLIAKIAALEKELA